MASQGMFGPSGAEVELALREQQKQEAMQYASMPAGRGPVALMAQAGQGIGRAIEGAAGYQDPRVAKAKLLEEAKMEVDESGADLMADPKGYYGAAFKALQSRGLTDEAMGVRQLMMQEEAQQATNAKNLRGTTKGYGMSGNIMYSKDDGTREVVPEYQGKGSTEDTSKNVAFFSMPDGRVVQAKKGSPEADEILAGGGVPYKNPSRDPAADAIRAGFEGIADLERAKAQGREGGKLDAKTMDTYVQEAVGALQINQSLDNISNSLASGDTTFGSFADQRRAVVSFLDTFSPSLAETGERILKLNLNEYDALERESTKMTAMLAKEVTGGRASAYVTELLKKAGPAVYQTNSGLRIVAKAMSKKNQYLIDRANYITTWQEENPGMEMPGSKVTRWQLDNASNPAYILTREDVTDAEALVKQAEKIKKYARRSVPRPKNRANLIDGRVYSEEEAEGPTFYTYDRATDKFTEVE